LLLLPSPAGLFSYRSCEGVPLPHSPVECAMLYLLLQVFPSLSTLQGGGAAAPTFFCWLVYSQFEWGFPSPTLQSSGQPSLFPKCLFFPSYLFIILIVFFLFFPWGGVSLSRGICCFTMCRLAHLLVCVFSSSLETGIWWCGSPPSFSV
jgi:hypothetical protein